MNDNTMMRTPRPALSFVLLLAGSLLVRFSMGRWLEWLAPAGFLLVIAWALIAHRAVK